jgi:hypothetical protein
MNWHQLHRYGAFAMIEQGRAMSRMCAVAKAKHWRKSLLQAPGLWCSTGFIFESVKDQWICFCSLVYLLMRKFP